MILIYRILTTLLYPILIIFIYFRKVINKEDSVRYKEKILSSHFNSVKRENSKLIWFHAASIGELKSIIPILKKLNNTNLDFLITTITLSSSKIAKIELKNFKNVHHRFFPLDVDFLMNKFLLFWKPNAIFFVDSEIWPNLICKASKKKIPLALINARLTAKTFKRWMLFPKTAKKIFGLFDLCLTSNIETKNYLENLNSKNIYFNGNIKLINEIDKNNITNLNKNIFNKRRFWLAASTHQGEDIFCLNTHSKLRTEFKDIITIIAPRHIERIKEINNLCENLGLNAQVLNDDDVILEDKEIILINSFGVLQKYFKYAKSVFIGKSIDKKLKNVGGQSPIDAAKFGCKIYHGPYVYNFKEIYEILKKNNISKEIKNYMELSDNLIKDLETFKKDENKISNLIDNLGKETLAKTMKYVNNFLFNVIK
jgi:3-deoxy-D-manno-octulosonic-acid transferase|tara:strand:- start:135 stop:1412 length:1278 start_codon:yes stop_codon:yes gene_type:complete